MQTRLLTRQVLLASIGLLTGVLAASVAVAVIAVQFQRAEQHNQHLVAAAQADAEMLKGFVDEETAYRGYLLTGDPAFLAPYTQAQVTLPATADTFLREFAASGGPSGWPRTCGARTTPGWWSCTSNWIGSPPVTGTRPSPRWAPGAARRCSTRSAPGTTR